MVAIGVENHNRTFKVGMIEYEMQTPVLKCVCRMRAMKKMPEKVLQTMRERTPMRRLGEASDEADFINGAVLRVDGGLTL
jgi:NAD(P)-dependent dehydrogenase (short-subunit alcohol dehydrogenase family)